MTEPPSPPEPPEASPAPCGWLSDLPAFCGAQPRVIRLQLANFVRDAGEEQLRAWDESIPWLQRECRELTDAYDAARSFTTILEYELPREARRPDVIVLENGVVVVLEVKGKAVPSQADIDQVFAYARDLRAYHRECADRPVHAVLVPSRADATPRAIDGVNVVGPAGVDRLLLECTRPPAASPLTPEAFLNREAYAPLRSLVPAPVRAPAAAAHQASPRRDRVDGLSLRQRDAGDGASECREASHQHTGPFTAFRRYGTFTSPKRRGIDLHTLRHTLRPAKTCATRTAARSRPESFSRECSQTRSTFQPSDLSIRLCLLSLLRFPATFSDQYFELSPGAL